MARSPARLQLTPATATAAMTAAAENATTTSFAPSRNAGPVAPPRPTAAAAAAAAAATPAATLIHSRTTTPATAAASANALPAAPCAVEPDAPPVATATTPGAAVTAPPRCRGATTAVAAASRSRPMAAAASRQKPTYANHVAAMSFTAILPSTTTTTCVTEPAELAPWAGPHGCTAALQLGPERLAGSSRVRSVAQPRAWRASLRRPLCVASFSGLPTSSSSKIRLAASPTSPPHTRAPKAALTAGAVSLTARPPARRAAAEPARSA